MRSEDDTGERAPDVGEEVSEAQPADTLTTTLGSDAGAHAQRFDAPVEESATFDFQSPTDPPSRSTTVSPRPGVGADSLMTPPPTSDNAPRKTTDAADSDLAASASSIRPRPMDEDNAEAFPPEMADSDITIEDFGVASPYPDFPSNRVNPICSSSYLRPGSRFHGTQQSERQVYDVQVEIKHVDLRESVLCGYLRIQGLTEDHPTLTTFFEGEIIGAKYGFLTDSNKWGATNKVDGTHWGKFGAFRPYLKAMRKPKGNVHIQDPGQKETIFMRWKEHFLVPDHRVKTITGASFEGFYYICFNQISGEISGIYFHSKSEKYQRLELKHQPDKGCFGAVEFR
jgi:hypothetical protein